MSIEASGIKNYFQIVTSHYQVVRSEKFQLKKIVGAAYAALPPTVATKNLYIILYEFFLNLYGNLSILIICRSCITHF